MTARPSLGHVLAVTALAGAVACGDTNFTPASQLTFDSPIDISFACYGGLRLTGGGPATVDQQIVTSAQPTEACDIHSLPRPKDENGNDLPPLTPPGQESLIDQGGLPMTKPFWYAFILQSGPGTVAVAEFETAPSLVASSLGVVVHDTDSLTPGKNGISVGEDPIAITGDRSGCWQLIANAGSCDMSALEVNSALDNEPSFNVQRFTIQNASGMPIDARPAALALNATGGVIGEACPATPIGIAYLAYPSCNLVAAVDVSTATVVGGIRFDEAGPAILTEAELATLSCPSECGGGGVIPSGTRPVTLDLEVGPVRGIPSERLLIGAENSNVVTLVEIDEVTHLPASVHPIPLEDPSGLLGVTHVALAPQIGMGGSAGFINDEASSGGHFNFAYAIATDDTIRVIALNGAVENGGPAVDLVECDTQVDPRLIHDLRNVRALSCFPVGRPGTPARRPGASSPGIELPGDALPTSIDIFREEVLTGTTSPSKLVGYFGVISASNGATFILNVDDDDYPDFEDADNPLHVTMPLAIAHQLRDGVSNRDLLAERTLTLPDMTQETVAACDDPGPDPDAPGGKLGGPRSFGNPTRSVAPSQVASEKAGQLPMLRQVLCTGKLGDGRDDRRPVSEVAFAAPPEVREQVYPDLRVLEDETWTMTWEGALSIDQTSTAVDGPPIRVSQIRVDQTGMRIFDDSAPFCDAGVEPYDIVQLAGCDPSLGDAQCPIGYTCFVHPNNQVAGLGACMLVDEADRLANACQDFLTSLRRYTVARADSGQLRLLPRKHVLRTTPVDGCVDDAQCESLAAHAAQLASGDHPRNDTTPEVNQRWVCAADPDRAPLDGPGQTGKRCIAACTETSECGPGRTCQGGYCMEGVIPPQSCVNAPQRYSLHAGEAFAVIGTRSGYVHPIIEDPTTGRCIVDPDAHSFDIGRVPLAAPPCDPAADPLTGRLPDGTVAPNPCMDTVEHTETVRVYADAMCTPADPATEIQTRQAPALRFRNRGLTLTLVDPYYPGDATCLGDRMGNLEKVPTVYPGYQLFWRQVGGFSPQLVSIDPAFPVKVVRGPTQAAWVIDAGDYLAPLGSTSASTRGRVYRIELSAFGQPVKLE